MAPEFSNIIWQLIYTSINETQLIFYVSVLGCLKIYRAGPMKPKFIYLCLVSLYAIAGDILIPNS